MERQVNAGLIESLVADLTPVTPMRTVPVLGRVAFCVLAAIACVAAVLGLRSDLSPLFVLSAGLFLMLGVASSLTAIAMARPQVGIDRTGWAWAAAMAALLPATTLIMALSHASSAWTKSVPHTGVACMMIGLLAGLASGAVLTAWLRRGAPSSPQRAGLVTGIATGSLGMFAAALHCPNDDIYHIGLWHSAAVLLAALLGRLIVPRLIRW